MKKIVHLRIRKRLGPVELAGQLEMASSTVHAVLKRCRLNRLSHIDVKTSAPAHRYEHETPGAQIHVDVKKLGNTPDGGRWRYVRRFQGDRNRAVRPQTNGKIERFHRTMADGWAYVKHHNSESARRTALTAWLHFYNPQTAIGKLPPISRISNNLAGQYT